MALINTHTAVKKFVQHGFTEEQAEIMVDVINDQSDHLATKEDIRIVRNEVTQVKTELKGEIAQIRTELTWIKAMLFAVLGLLLAPMVAQFVALYFK